MYRERTFSAWYRHESLDQSIGICSTELLQCLLVGCELDRAVKILERRHGGIEATASAYRVVFYPDMRHCRK